MATKTVSKPVSRGSARLRAAESKLATRLLLDAWFGTMAPTTIQQDIEALQLRIVELQSDCDVWRVVGPKEKYLDACFMVEALTNQLDECLRNLSAGPPMP